MNIDGPQQVRNIINQDPVVSPQISLLNQQGSHVVFGDLLVVPIEDGFLYVQPVFVESNQGGTVIPELKKVVVVHGQTVTISDSLVNALARPSARRRRPSREAAAHRRSDRRSSCCNQALTHFSQRREAAAPGRPGRVPARDRSGASSSCSRRRSWPGTKGGGGHPAGTSSPSPSPSPSGSPSG